MAVLHRYGAGLSIDLAKWGEARGIPVVPELLRGVYAWLASIDVSWAQELCIYMFIWMAKFGAAYGVRTGIHVGVDVLVNMLSPKSRKPVILFAHRCAARCSRRPSRRSAQCSSDEMYKTGQQSNDLEAPMWIVYSGDPAGLRADVLPLPAGRLVVLLDRRTAASQRSAGRGHRRDAMTCIRRPTAMGLCRATGPIRSRPC